MISKKDLIAANKNRDDYSISYYSPLLRAAQNLNYDISDQPVVSGARYGNAPECGLSYNFRDNCQEKGLSLAYILGDDKTKKNEVLNLTIALISDRPVIEFTGFLLKEKGADGEPLILPFNVCENYD